MHLFDSQWPTRPTFGVDLQPKDDEDGAEWAVRPKTGQQRSHQMTPLFDFGHALADTMQNGVDVTQLSLPAYRGRVAGLRLTTEEGGMNLSMPPEVVQRIAARGRDAASVFDDFDRPDHQNKRFAASMAAIDDLLAGIRAANSDGFAAIVDFSTPFDRRAAAKEVIELAERWATDQAHPHPAVGPDLPHPVADLRGAPRL